MTDTVKKSKIINSYYIKAHLLNYFRFHRGYMYIACECGDYKADFIACDGKEFIEVEIKTTYQDFIADFKKRKHKRYKKLSGMWTPNRFYFIVPENIVEKCAEYLRTAKLKYGLLVIADDKYYGKQLPQIYFESTCDAIHIVKKAQALHTERVSLSVINSIVQRQSSELCKKYAELHCKK